MYHRIAEDPLDPYSLCVAQERFAAHVRVMTQSAEIVGLDALGEPASGPQIVLTFDDGYADNLLAALPVVESAQAPITVFVTSGMLGEKAGFWWDRLARLLCGRKEVALSVSVAGRPLRIDLRGRHGVALALIALHTRLRNLPISEVERCLQAIAEQLETPLPDVADARVMTTDELRGLAASPLVTIGAHTVDHEMLAGRPLADQIATMDRSRKDLETLVGGRVEHFAYPYGDGEAFDASSVQAARACGFSTACTALERPGQLPQRPPPSSPPDGSELGRGRAPPAPQGVEGALRCSREPTR